MECNDHDAFSYMACMYGLGAAGLPQDGTKAVKLFEKAIKLGSVVAHNHLGHMYDKGDVLKEDKKKAIKQSRTDQKSKGSPANNTGGTRNSGDEDNRSDEQKAKTKAANAKKKARHKKLYGNNPGYKS